MSVMEAGRPGSRESLTTAMVEMEHASGRLEAHYAGLQEKVLAMAGQLSEKGRHLQNALTEKQRLAKLLDTVLESIEAGVVLIGPSGAIVAANAASRTLGVVVESAGESRLIPVLSGRGERDGVLLPFGPGQAAWDLRWSRVALGELGESRLLLVQDVTRLVRLEETARRRSSLEALGRMAAEVAHEVRNPLGALELCATMLVEDLEAQPESLELAEQILLGVRQLSGTVTRLLSTVRGSRTRLSSQDASALAREVVSLLVPVALSRGLTMTGPENSEKVRGQLDPEGLRQALLNLVGNALEVTSEGGEVLVSVEANSGELHVAVSDSGPGVPAEERTRIFEPFYSTRNEGTGLGLVVVERFAGAHGGRVEVRESTLGGALFCMILPVDGGVQQGAR